MGHHNYLHHSIWHICLGLHFSSCLPAKILYEAESSSSAPATRRSHFRRWSVDDWHAVDPEQCAFQSQCHKTHQGNLWKLLCIHFERADFLQALKAGLRDLEKAAPRYWPTHQERVALAELLQGLEQGLKTDQNLLQDLHLVSNFAPSEILERHNAVWVRIWKGGSNLEVVALVHCVVLGSGS